MMVMATMIISSSNSRISISNNSCSNMVIALVVVGNGNGSGTGNCHGYITSSVGPWVKHDVVAVMWPHMNGGDSVRN